MKSKLNQLEGLDSIINLLSSGMKIRYFINLKIDGETSKHYEVMIPTINEELEDKYLEKLNSILEKPNSIIEASEFMTNESKPSRLMKVGHIDCLTGDGFVRVSLSHGPKMVKEFVFKEGEYLDKFLDYLMNDYQTMVMDSKDDLWTNVDI
ncbi:hypothetical protein NXZ75_06820 [Lysinibacillus sphaericus]|uniref:hypothetical protein n=1 Tax=Lysinibacillus sphaericus TaxID=1421 RepID=UPI002162C00C|nr:hypothetical protein [Lysinibacillus sphaericus]MCS1381900.1 hypothetical protein [Lysinibacillus sphaericus]